MRSTFECLKSFEQCAAAASYYEFFSWNLDYIYPHAMFVRV